MALSKDVIHFITTWWTIDSAYDGTKDTVVPTAHSAIPSYIQSLKLYLNAKFTEVCQKDSRSLTMSDLKKILQVIEKSPSKNVIITHGTYTMPDTARFLKSHMKRKDQNILLVWSMIPLVGFSPSDAGFALGFAVAKIQMLKPWIYVCMNGKTFVPEEVAKLLSSGKFVSMFGNRELR